MKLLFLFIIFSLISSFKIVDFQLSDEIHTGINTNVNFSEPSNGIIVYPNYPNPFTSITKIPIDLKVDKPKLRFIIMNSKGQVMAFMTLENFNSGHHTIEIKFDTEPTGIYLYMFEIDNATTQLYKMVYIK